MEQIPTEIAALKTQMNTLMARQEEMAKVLAENNVLLRRNMGLFEVTQTLFPIDSEDKLKKLEEDLTTNERRTDMVGAIRRIVCGSVQNIYRILHKNIIMEFNYDGSINKKSLKLYGNVLNVLFEATKKEGTTYEDFTKDFRITFRRIKNSTNKENARIFTKK